MAYSDTNLDGGSQIGTTIEEAVLAILGYGLGSSGSDSSIDQSVRPVNVGQPGSAQWIVMDSKQDKLTAGWKPGATAGKITFWRKMKGTHIEWVEVSLAGGDDAPSPSLTQPDTSAGGGTLTKLRDAWATGFYQNVPNLMGVGKVLDPTSIDDLATVLRGASDFFETHHNLMTTMIGNLDQDADSFRGSASQAFVQRVGVAMVKVAGTKPKTDQWTPLLGTAATTARTFHKNFIDELNALAALHNGTMLIPQNYLIDLLSHATMTTTYHGDMNGNVNTDNNIQTQSVFGTIPNANNTDIITIRTYTPTILISSSQLPSGATYDVFNPADWIRFDQDVRAAWAVEMAAAWPHTLASAAKLVTDLQAAAQALNPPKIVPNPKILPPPPPPTVGGGNGPDLNIPNDGGGGGGGGGDGLNGDGLNGGGGGGGDGLNGDGLNGGGGGGDNGLNGDGLNGGGGGGDNGLNADALNGGGGGGDNGLNGDGLNGGGGGGDNGLNADAVNGLGGGGGLPGGGSLNGLGGGAGGGGGLTADDGLGDDGLGADGLGADGLGGGPAQSLGDLTPDQLGALQSSGLLDNTPLTPAQLADLQAAGMPATTGESLGDLTPAQLNRLQQDGQLSGNPVTPADSSALQALGMGTGADSLGNDLGDLSPAQLGALQSAGLLNDVPLSPADASALQAAGMPASAGGSLGSLTPAQLGTLQNAGLLNGVPLTPADAAALQNAGLGTASTGLGNDLGDLSPTQLSALQSGGLLNNVPLTGAETSALQAAGIPAPAGSTLGSLSPSQLGTLQQDGLLNGVPLTPAESSALTAAGLGGGSGGLTPALDSLGTGGFGTSMPSTQFPTAINGVDVSTPTVGSTLPAYTMGNVSAPLSHSLLGGSVGVGGGGVTPHLAGGAGSLGGLAGGGGGGLGSAGGGGSLGSGGSVGGGGLGGLGSGTSGLGGGGLGGSGLDGLGTGVGSLAGAAGAAGAAGSSSSGGQSMMPPMGGMGGMGGGAGNEKTRERSTWLTEDEDVWGTDPDCAPAVIGRGDDYEVLEPVQTPALPTGPRPARPDRTEQRPGRAR